MGRRVSDEEEVVQGVGGLEEEEGVGGNEAEEELPAMLAMSRQEKRLLMVMAAILMKEEGDDVGQEDGGEMSDDVIAEIDIDADEDDTWQLPPAAAVPGLVPSSRSASRCPRPWSSRFSPTSRCCARLRFSSGGRSARRRPFGCSPTAAALFRQRRRGERIERIKGEGFHGGRSFYRP